MRAVPRCGPFGPTHAIAWPVKASDAVAPARPEPITVPAHAPALLSRFQPP